MIATIGEQDERRLEALSIERVDDRQHRSFGAAPDELGQHEPDSDGLSTRQGC